MTVYDEETVDVVESRFNAGTSSSVGMVFAEARTQRDLSLEEVSAHLKFGITQLRALEQSDWAYFSKPVLLKGMIRNYAKFLDIDPEPILSEIDPFLASNIDVLEPLGRLETPLPKTGFFASVDRSWMSTRTLLIIVVSAVVVIAGLLFYSWGSKESSEVAAEDSNPEMLAEGGDAVAPSTPSNTAAATPPPARATPEPVVTTPTVNEATTANLVLQAKGRSWIELRGPDKEVLFSKTILAGETHQLTASAGSNLVIGNVDAVSVTWKEKALNLTSTERGTVARLTLN